MSKYVLIFKEGGERNRWRIARVWVGGKRGKRGKRERERERIE
jgi:hypothetical protein